MAQHLPPEALNAWLAAAADKLGVDPAGVDIATVLNVAKDVAHGVARPAAPLTTFLLGFALGQGAVDGASEPGELHRLATQVGALVSRWE